MTLWPTATQASERPRFLHSMDASRPARLCAGGVAPKLLEARRYLQFDGSKPSRYRAGQLYLLQVHDNSYAIRDGNRDLALIARQ